MHTVAHWIREAVLAKTTIKSYISMVQVLSENLIEGLALILKLIYLIYIYLFLWLYIFKISYG